MRNRMRSTLVELAIVSAFIYPPTTSAQIPKVETRDKKDQVEQGEGHRPKQSTGKQSDIDGTRGAIDRGKEEEYWRDILNRLDMYLELASTFKDQRLKAIVTSWIANYLWDHDRERSKSLFERALRYTSNDDDSSKAENKALAAIRSRIITMVVARDKELAEKYRAWFSNEKDSKKTSQDYLIDAYRATQTDPKLGMELADKSLQSGIPKGFHALLAALRQEDVEGANRLFLRALNNVDAQLRPDVESLLYLGTYLFSSPLSQSAGSTASPQAERFIMVPFAGEVIPDLRADKPNVPAQLVQPYLRTFTEAISKPGADLKARRQSFAAAQMLAPRIEKYVPDLSAQFQTAVRDLRQTMLAPEEKLAPSWPTEEGLAERIKKVDSLASNEQRDAEYFKTYRILYDRSDFSQSKEIASKITKSAVRDKLVQLSDFGQASSMIAKGDKDSLTQAMALSIKYYPSFLSSWLMAGVSKAYIKLKDYNIAKTIMTQALAAARQSEDRRAFSVLIAISGQYAEVGDDDFALSLFSEAMAISEREGFSLPRAAVSTETVELGAQKYNLPIRVNGIASNVSNVIKSLAKSNLKGIMDTIGASKNEEFKSQAIVWLVEALPKPPPAKPTSSGPKDAHN